MNRAEFEAWKKEQCQKVVTESFNGVEYKLCQRNDGWIAIFEYNILNGFVPLIEAKDIEHARDYCSRREIVSVAVKKLSRYL